MTLFDVPEPSPAPVSKESEQRSRTRRQHALMVAGKHPLSLTLSRPLRLHAEAAPHDERDAEGRRCGNCVHRTNNHHGYPKCGFGDGVRATRGGGSDCRAFWPGCVDHEWRNDG